MTEALKDVPRLFNAVWFNSRYEGIQRKLSLKKHPDYAKNNEVRMKAFAGFKKGAFKDFSDEYIGYAALCEGGKKYSAVITGSDQLWSPAGLPTNYYNLMFVPDDTLKISIASSFGVKEIPWYQKKRTVQYLNRIEYISMRENRGSEIGLVFTWLMLLLIYKAESIQSEVSKVAEALGDTGRILVRESGTEPVVRVMVEAPDHDTCQKYVDEVVNVICEKGYKV